MLNSDHLGGPVDKSTLTPGVVYAIPEKAGHMLCMRADIDGKTHLALLAVVGTTTPDTPPVLIRLDAIAASRFHPVEGAFVAARHNAGEERYEPTDGDALRHGDFVEDDLKRPFLYFKQKGFSPLMLSLEEGVAYPAFDPVLSVHRWTVRTNADKASPVIAAHGGD